MKTILIICIAALLSTGCYEIMPRNTLKDCGQQCKGSVDSIACCNFCDCIHKEGKPLDSCLDEFEKEKRKQSRSLEAF